MWCCPAPPLLARLLPALPQGARLGSMPPAWVVESPTLVQCVQQSWLIVSLATGKPIAEN